MNVATRPHDPSDPRPQYVRIGDVLRDRIREGHYGIGTLLPTESELCEEFSISRHTVREALRRLCEEGLIERKQGSGSRVLAAEAHQNYVHAMRSLDQLFQYASDTRFQIASTQVAIPDTTLFPEIVTDRETPWLIVTALRLERDENVPICYSLVLVNHAFAAIAEDLHTGSGAIYRRIEERFDVEVFEVIQDITVVPIPPEAAAALGEEGGAVAVRVVRRYLGTDGTVLLASANYHPADRFSYSMRLQREGGRG